MNHELEQNGWRPAPRHDWLTTADYWKEKSPLATHAGVDADTGQRVDTDRARPVDENFGAGSAHLEGVIQNDTSLGAWNIEGPQTVDVCIR